MPINPNIALGTQQQQPVNFLGQMGQALALKAAAQEVQGGEDLRAAYASGGNMNDPEFQRKIMAANPKLGAQLIKTSAETQRINNEALTKAYANSREALSMVRSPQELLAYSVSQFNDPLIGPSLKARGLTPETVAANLQKELSTSGFENVLKKSAMGLDGWFKDQTSRRNTDVSAGPGYMQANLAKEKFEFDKANPQLSMAQGDTGFYLYNPRDPNSAVPLGMRPTAPVAPPAQPSTVSNMLVSPSGAQPSINALVQPAPNQPGAPTIANANALANQPTIIRPKQPIRQPVAVIKDGQVTLVPPEQAVGMTPATPGAEKALEKKQIAQEGKESVNRVLGNLYSEYTNLVKTGGITDTRKSVEDNIAARTGASAVGQVAGSYAGTEEQSFRDSIEQTRPLLLTAIMKATGLSATQLNSNVELQTYLRTATDPKVSIQSNVKALNNISQMFGLGEKFEVPETSKAPTTGKVTPSAPSGAIVTTPDGRTIVFPDANAAARFKKEAGIK